MQKMNESGRSILEVILVITIIIFISMWALAGYQNIISKRIANTIYNDILIEVQSKRGKNFRGKSIYDSGFGQKTRYGHLIVVSKDLTQRLYHLNVKDVQNKVCPFLRQMDWSKALGTKNYTPENVVCTEKSDSDSFDFKFDFAQ